MSTAKAGSIRHATAVHEAAHAVMSFMLGLDFGFIVMWDDENAEVVPECASCSCCDHYYEKNDPRVDAHARSIQDQLRSVVAVSVAGEVADVLLSGNVPSETSAELAADRRKSRRTACFLHIWTGGCSNNWEQPCALSDPFLTNMRATVEVILKTPEVWSAVQDLAEVVAAPREGPLHWGEAADLFGKKGIKYRSLPASSLPTAP